MLQMLVIMHLIVAKLNLINAKQEEISQKFSAQNQKKKSISANILGCPPKLIFDG